MPKGVYERSEEQKRKISESRIRYYDEHGRVVNINQNDSPEAYREYMKAYQKLWRKKNTHYYRDLKRKKKEVQDMSKLQEIQNLWNEIVCSAVSNEYNNFEKKTDIMPLVDKLHEMLTKYASEVKEENKEDERN